MKGKGYGHPARSVAEYILKRCRDEKINDSLTPMQLIKLVYIAHGWVLGLLGHPLVKEEIEAWQYGPVIPDLYAALKVYRSSPVDKVLGGDASQIENQDECSIINQVCDIYGKFDGIELSRLTHQAESPWSTSWEEGRSSIISNDLIEHHYKQLATAA